jgi:hypothetical protein
MRVAIYKTKHTAVTLTKQEWMSKGLSMTEHPSQERPQTAIVSIKVFSKHHRRALVNACGKTRLDCSFLYRMQKSKEDSINDQREVLCCAFDEQKRKEKKKARLVNRMTSSEQIGLRALARLVWKNVV